MDPDFQDKPDPPVLAVVIDALVEAAKALEGIATGYTAGADNAVVFLEDGSEGPHRRETCRDHHAQCPNWAKWVRSRACGIMYSVSFRALGDSISVRFRALAFSELQGFRALSFRELPRPLRRFEWLSCSIRAPPSHAVPPATAPRCDVPAARSRAAIVSAHRPPGIPDRLALCAQHLHMCSAMASTGSQLYAL